MKSKDIREIIGAFFSLWKINVIVMAIIVGIAMFIISPIFTYFRAEFYQVPTLDAFFVYMKLVAFYSLIPSIGITIYTTITHSSK